MADDNRFAAVVLEVADLERSLALYRDGFGLDLHVEPQPWGHSARYRDLDGNVIEFTQRSSFG